MAGITNKGKMRLLEWAFRDNNPTNLYVALVTSAVAPGPDTNTLGQLTQIAAGNGYSSGGYQVNLDGTDFDVLQEDDGNDRAYIQLKDIIWNASGGPIPASGSGARYAVLTDDNAAMADREVIAFWDLGSDQSAPDGQSLTLQDLELRIND